MNKFDGVALNLLILLLMSLMLIGTVVSKIGGLGLLVGATIVTFWNITKL